MRWVGRVVVVLVVVVCGVVFVVVVGRVHGAIAGQPSLLGVRPSPVKPRLGGGSKCGEGEECTGGDCRGRGDGDGSERTGGNGDIVVAVGDGGDVYRILVVVVVVGVHFGRAETLEVWGGGRGRVTSRRDLVTEGDTDMEDYMEIEGGLRRGREGEAATEVNVVVVVVYRALGFREWERREPPPVCEFVRGE